MNEPFTNQKVEGSSPSEPVGLWSHLGLIRTIYRPLTFDEFASGCPFIHESIPVCEDEDGEWVWTFDHVDPAVFAAAVAAYDEQFAGLAGDELEPLTAAGVHHRWALTVAPSEEWQLWWPDNVTAATPHAIPITLASR